MQFETAAHRTIRQTSTVWRGLFSVAALAVLIGALTSIDIKAQQEGINRIALGSLDIAIGDDQSRTLEKLRSRYTLSEEKADPKIGTFRAGVSAWKFSKDGDSGNVGFDFGRVSFVARMWSPHQTAADASLALIVLC